MDKTNQQILLTNAQKSFDELLAIIVDVPARKRCQSIENRERNKISVMF